jgi:hypothetical protein
MRQYVTAIILEGKMGFLRSLGGVSALAGIYFTATGEAVAGALFFLTTITAFGFAELVETALKRLPVENKIQG